MAKAEVSGPGFINITLADDWIAEQTAEQLADPRLGVAAADPSLRVVVDYSGPNVAKELHAGHLRPTVVGDAIVRVMEYLGHDVVRAAHLGDWGTPFGMLIEHALDIGDQATYDQLASGEFTAFYQAARAKFDADPVFADRARKRVVQLQAGEPEAMRLWQVLVDDSMEYLRQDLRTAEHHAHRCGHGTGELLQPDAQRRLRRAGEPRPRGDERRRAVRVPARFHRPGRQAACR